MNLENKREVELLERKIADLEHTVMQLRNSLDGIEFSVIDVGRQNEPTYTQKNRVSVSMGVQKGISEELISNSDLSHPPATGTYVWLSVNGVASWVELETFVCPR